MSWEGVEPADILQDVTPTMAHRLVRENWDTSSAISPISAGLLHGGPAYHTKRPNGRSDWLLFLTIGGNGLFRSGDSTIDVQPHHAVLLFEGTSQDYRSTPGSSPWIFAFVHVRPRPGWRRSVSWPEPCDGIAVLSIDDALVWRNAWVAMTVVRQLLTSPVRGRIALAMNALESVLLWCDEASPSRGPLLDERVRRAAELASQSVSRPLTVAEMAWEAAVSASRLTVLFREQIGESPGSYAERVRLEHAARLIQSAGLNVQEAAAASGYSDVFHFSRRFARRMGLPPSRWRSRPV